MEIQHSLIFVFECLMLDLYPKLSHLLNITCLHGRLLVLECMVD